MENSDERSIYREICRLVKAHPGLPYSFQAEDAGEYACRALLGGDAMPGAIRQALAYRVCEQLVEGSVDPAALPEEDIIWYAEEIRLRMRALWEAGILHREPLMIQGMRLATESRSHACVALGILILGQFENDIARGVVRRLALHSVFTPYAVVAIRGTAAQMSFGFELLRHTAGYGQLALLAGFLPVTEGQRSWFLTYGVPDAVIRPLAADLCMRSPDMRCELLDANPDEKKFHQLSCVLAYAAQAHGLHEYSIGAAMMREYLEHTQYARTFLDLAALLAIRRDLPDGDAASRAKLDAVLGALPARTLLYNEMRSPEQDSDVILAVAGGMGVEPDFGRFLPLIARDYFPLCVIRFLLEKHLESYRTQLTALLKQILPETVFDDEPLAGDMPHDAQHRPDVWLEALLIWMSESHDCDEPFFLRCLGARASEVRAGAVRALRAMRANWSEGVIPALNARRMREPCPRVQKRILRLLKIPEQAGEKEQRYVNAEDVQARPAPADRRILRTSIAGAWFHDLSVVEGQLEAGDVLLLKREADNPHDARAILVLAEDGYVLGYIPRADNLELSARMDAGERFYARLRENMHGNRPEIDLYWVPPASNGGNVLRFPDSGKKESPEDFGKL